MAHPFLILFLSFYCLINNSVSFTLNRKIVYNDLNNIAPEHYVKHITLRLAEIKAVDSPADRGIFIQMLESVYRFSLGAVAGGM